MHAKMERLKHLYGWDSSYATMTPTASNNSYKYPDGVVLTLKTCNHADYYFVERTFALQLASLIKESLSNKKGKPQNKPQNKPAQVKPAKVQKKIIKQKPEKVRAD
jgi:hypothetical protein